jgi:hypothetical protein
LQLRKISTTFTGLNRMIYSMMKKGLIIEIKWLFVALILSLVLVSVFDGTVLRNSNAFLAQHTFLGLNLFLEILIFFVFSTFVVFGIKGFFEMYSQKASNAIIFISGVFLAFVIFVLCYQILFQE